MLFQSVSHESGVRYWFPGSHRKFWFRSPAHPFQGWSDSGAIPAHASAIINLTWVQVITVWHDATIWGRALELSGHPWVPFLIETICGSKGLIFRVYLLCRQDLRISGPRRGKCWDPVRINSDSDLLCAPEPALQVSIYSSNNKLIFQNYEDMYLILSLWIVGWNILSMAKNIDKFCHIENTLPGRKHHKKMEKK